MKVLRFLYEFFIGDDWSIAIAVVVAMALTWILAHHGSNAWWLILAALAVVLPLSLWRATRSR